MSEDLQFVMKFGVVRTGEGPSGFEDLVQLACEQAKVSKERAEILDGEDAALLTVASGEEADRVIERLLELATDHARRSRELRGLHVHAGLAVGAAHRAMPADQARTLFESARADAVRSTGADATPHSEVLITHEAYEKLPPERQDSYRPSEELERLTVHRRYASHLPRCFVVSPIGSSDSEDRQRADDVYEKYIKPACEGKGLRPVRGEQMAGTKILPDIEEALHNDPLVIAYLGHGAENRNVIWELGYRTATGLPVVVLKDEDGPALPFDLKDVRCAEIPASGRETQTGEKIRTIRNYIDGALSLDRFAFARPCARVNVNVRDSGKSRFVEASESLEDLFDCPRLAGRKLGDVIKDLVGRMPETQRAPFLSEQASLIQRLAVPDPLAQGGTILQGATIPIVFDEHERYHGRAFLPVIVESTRLGELIQMRVVYIDVTNVAKQTEEGFFACSLAGRTQAELIHSGVSTGRP